MGEERRGAMFGAAAFVLWGLFPLYWPLFEPAGAGEILAQRILWSMLAILVLLAVTSHVGGLVAIWRSPRLRTLMTCAAALIGVNWFTYIWGVNNGYVVETSLGYYINPLVTVLLGVLVLGERLRRLQWVALAIGFVAVLTLSVELGRPPYIALVLAFSFGGYGLVKKRAGVGAAEGIAFETIVLAPLALAYLVRLTAVGSAQSWSQGPWHVVLLSTMGLVTTAPLLFFAGAANRVSLSTVGLLQYITPTLQFTIGVAVFHEPMPLGRWAGFLLVWVALAILTAESLVVMRRAAVSRARRHAEDSAQPHPARELAGAIDEEH